MRLTLSCGCRFELSMFIGQINSVIDIISDDDQITLCVKHMSSLINDYTKVVNRIILSKSVVNNSTPIQSLKEKLKLIKLYEKEYPKRLEMLNELDNSK